jgi:hypothetical protein
MPVTQTTVERVAEKADELGFQGIDETPAIALGEYNFLAKWDENEKEWTVLFRVPDWAPGGPGFKFFTVEYSDVREWAHKHAPLVTLGFGDKSSDEYMREVPDILKLSDYIRHCMNPQQPMSYVDDPLGMDDTLTALDEHHS